MNFNNLYKMVIETVTILPNTEDPFEQELINRLPSSEYNLDKIVSWYRRDKESGVPQSELEQIYTTKLDDMVSTLVDYYTELKDYREHRGNDPRFLKNPFEQYRYSKGFFQNIEKIKFEINELRDENLRLKSLSGKKKDKKGTFVVLPENKTRIKLIDSSTNVMVWSTEGFDTTNRFVFNFWGNANMNVEYGDPDTNSPYCTRIRGNWKEYSKNSITKPYQQIWFFLKPKGNYDYSTGDLTKPSVAELFSACNLQGPNLLLCMDDTAFDLLDRYDRSINDGFGDNEYINPVIEEVKKLDKRFRDKFLAPINKLAQDKFVKTGVIPHRLRPHITRIEIPDGAKSISERAFEGCSRLTSVTIPDSVTSIKGRAFYDCHRLTNVTIPDSVTSIGVSVFSGCRGLTSVTIPDSVTSLGIWVFRDCVSLTSIKIPNSITSIGDYAFYNCYNLKSVTIPDSVTSIGEYAFYNCESLTSVTIPDNVTSIKRRAFYCCEGLTSVTIGNSVIVIGEWAFYKCGSLTSIKIPDSVKYIGYDAFTGCKKVTIQATPMIAELLRNTGFEGDIKRISNERHETSKNFMREFVEVLKMEE